MIKYLQTISGILIICIMILATNVYGENSLVGQIKQYIPHVQSPAIDSNNIDALYGYYDDEPYRTEMGQISGEQLYLFPDNTYYFLMWTDFISLTIYDKGHWSYENGVLKLNSDQSVKQNDYPKDHDFVTLLDKSDQEEHLLLMGRSRGFKYFKTNIKNKYGKVDPIILELATLNKKSSLNLENFLAIKNKVYHKAWRPEFFEEEEMTERKCVEEFGGEWGPFGELREDMCNLRSPDAGKICNDSLDCRLGDCIAEITNAEAEMLIDGKVLTKSGKCSEFEFNNGCHPFVENGMIGGVLCKD